MGGWLFGVDITEGAKTWSPTTYKPFSTFSPQYQMDYSYAPNIQISSPGATGSTITTKKEASSTPTQTGATVTAPTTGTETDPMGTVLLIAALAVGGFVVVGYLNRGKKKK